VGATIPSARMQEIVFTTPGILPEEAWAPLAVLTRGDGSLLEVLGDGRVRIPAHPGLGIDVDDEALERLRVPDERHGKVHVRS
jgi:L-alanine-DL-glutamate epimerase-like enolase superfamily enzyme